MTGGHDGFHLAQVNVGRLLHPQDAPEVADFMNGLDQINALAERSPGFVWRLTGEGNSAVDVKAFEDPTLLINLSVWTDLAALGAFVYRSDHLAFMRRRREWFEASTDPILALWWVPAGARPTTADAGARLAHLAAHGPSPFAFSFKHPFPPLPRAAPVTPVLDECA
jgi:hypothetical protein